MTREEYIKQIEISDEYFEELDKISEKYVNLNYSEMLRIHIEKEMQMWLDEKRLNSSLFGKINVNCEWDEDLNHLKIILS